MNTFVPAISWCVHSNYVEEWAPMKMWFISRTNISNAHRFTIVAMSVYKFRNQSRFQWLICRLLHWLQSHYLLCQCEIIQLLLNALQTLSHSIKLSHLAISSLRFHSPPCDGRRHYHKHYSPLQPMRSELQLRCCCRSKIEDSGPTIDSPHDFRLCGRRHDCPRPCWCGGKGPEVASAGSSDSYQRREFGRGNRECSATPLNSLNPFVSVRPCCSSVLTRIPRTPQFALIYRCTVLCCCSDCCYCCCYWCWYFQLWEIKKRKINHLRWVRFYDIP